MQYRSFEWRYDMLGYGRNTLTARQSWQSSRSIVAAVFIILLCLCAGCSAVSSVERDMKITVPIREDNKTAEGKLYAQYGAPRLERVEPGRTYESAFTVVNETDRSVTIKTWTEAKLIEAHSSSSGEIIASTDWQPSETVHLKPGEKAKVTYSATIPEIPSEWVDDGYELVGSVSVYAEEFILGNG